MNSRKIQRYIKSLLPRRNKRKTVLRRDMISIRESDGKKFRKRKRKILLSFFRKFSIPLWKVNVFYYSVGIWSLVLVWIIWTLIGPFLNVKEIYITRWNNTVNIDIAYQSVDSIRWKKVFLVDTNSIKKSLLQRQKSIKDIDISIQFPSSININIIAYDSIFESQLNETLYTIVENGTIIPLTNSSSTPYLHIYMDENRLPNILDYKRIFQPKYLNSITYLKNSLIENMVQLQIRWLHYYTQERELIIELENGGDLIFDLTKNLDEQIEKVVIFNNEWWDITKRNLIYTDFRIDNKVFFCDITTEFLCRVNLRDIYGDKKENLVTPDLEVSSLSQQ